MDLLKRPGRNFLIIRVKNLENNGKQKILHPKPAREQNDANERALEDNCELEANKIIGSEASGEKQSGIYGDRWRTRGVQVGDEWKICLRPKAPRGKKMNREPSGRQLRTKKPSVPKH